MKRPTQGASHLALFHVVAQRYGSSAVLFRISVFVLALLITLLPLGLSESRYSSNPNSVDHYLMTHGYYAMNVAELRHIVRINHFEVFWVGPMVHAQYTLDASEKGRISIRYLPQGMEIDATGTKYLVVSTYHVSHAYDMVVAAQKKPMVVNVSHVFNTRILFFTSTPNNIYVAFPGREVQVEIYHWRPGKALNMALTAGLLRAI